MGIENYQNEILTFFISSVYRYINLLTAFVKIDFLSIPFSLFDIF